MPETSLASPWTVVATYLAASVVWIVASDALVGADPAWQTAKGLGFVGATGAVLLVVLLRHRARQRALRRSLEAERLIAAEDVDVLVSDVVMPGRQGPEVAARARVERPDLRIVFTSGYSQAIARAGDLPEGAELLAEPFTPSRLVAAVWRALGGGRSGTRPEPSGATS